MAGHDERVLETSTGTDQRPESSLEPELENELHRFGLSGDLAAAVLKKDATEVVSFASAVILLPIDFFASSTSRGFDEEILGLGLRHSVQLLRPHGPSQILGETLLSLERFTF
ncbi:hypothetical protein [Bradyrhizobium manausense]|uniref:Uncharacterized protein n=1 Tax=Bradyrhizobium manausense TaxID=989370 RepID=A0A0R3EAP3_9BRAD|nr:hypothetical protein [Bradyrhizobium manausense]KRQ16706.1 hypothetical protein AOQ71_04530 [Bradyrhizobium manausense]